MGRSPVGNGRCSSSATATEAAAVSAFYLLVVEVFIYRDLGLRRDLPRIMRESMILVGGILVILGAALGFTSYLVDAEVPSLVTGWVSSHVGNRLAFILLLNLFLLATRIRCEEASLRWAKNAIAVNSALPPENPTP